MTKEQLEAFLASFDYDRERAGEEYEQTRRKLLTFFRGRGIITAEDAADEVINRVAKRSHDGDVQDVRSFIWGVARRVASEIHMKTKDVSLSEALEAHVNPIDMLEAEEERRRSLREQCVRRCLRLLATEQRELIEEWYLYDKGDRIENRKRLAVRLQTTLPTLTVRAFRARQKLRQLVDECMTSAFSAVAR
jgi:DNA-directed RNA polymerase specialized sigma24 family protein